MARMPSYTEEEASPSAPAVLLAHLRGTRNRRSSARRAAPERRKVPRPAAEQLLAAVHVSSYVAVAAKYGVSERAVRKGIRAYEREGARGSADEPATATLPT